MRRCCFAYNPSRLHAASRTLRRGSTTASNPYAVLQLHPHSDYDTVKTAFLKAALQHHPDRQGGNQEKFLRVRQAFETILKQKNEEKALYKNEKDFNRWFEEESRQFLSFEMNDATVKEVVRVYRTMSSGGKDKGGYWEMARLITERAMHARNKKGTTRLTPGDGPVTEPASSLRRKKKR